MDPLIIAFGKGQIDGFLMDSNGVLDVVGIFSRNPQVMKITGLTI
jgi:hypothetical protein